MTAYQNPVGQNLPRLEAREKITGRAEYSDDLSRPGMLHAAVQQSPYAHARILSCDVSAALELPGVVACFTGDDIGYNYIGPFVHDETAIAKGKVRYIGEPVAAVAAVDQLTARRAVALIDVEYEELPAVLSIDQALAEDAPIVHDNFEELVKIYESEHTPNVMSIMQVEEGDVETAWAQCDVIVEG